jgi:hypothetical protein
MVRRKVYHWRLLSKTDPVLPEDSKLGPKHVGDTPLIFT